MNHAENIESLLRLATLALGETGPLFRDVIGLEKSQALKSLGNALCSIREISSALYTLYPALIADQEKLLTQDQQEFHREASRLREAYDAEKNGAMEQAKTLFETIASESAIRDYRIHAQAGLYRISKSQKS